ncbi:MAG: LCP family protein [Cyanobacteriota bacterium]|nr:LCP family protein [Cyanobacteriota bacterium]
MSQARPEPSGPLRPVGGNRRPLSRRRRPSGGGVPSEGAVPSEASSGGRVTPLVPVRPAPPPARSPRRRPERRAGLLGLPLLPFAAGIALGYGLATPLPQRLAASLGPTLQGLLHSPGHLAPLLDPFGVGNRHILVIGTDAVGANTDVILAIRVKDGRTAITQVPRDTYVETDDLGVVKANSLYAYGGMQRARSELSGLLGTPLDRHLRVNLAAVTKVADALGGVEIDVPKRMYYTDSHQDLTIDLYPGRQVLRGRDLEGYLRFRHDAMGDIGRMERQREVLNKVFSRLTQPSTLVQLPALLKIAGEDIETDLSPLEFTRLVTAMTRTNLSTSLLPGRAYWSNDLSYWMPLSNSHYNSHDGEQDPPY